MNRIVYLVFQSSLIVGALVVVVDVIPITIIISVS